MAFRTKANVTDHFGLATTSAGALEIKSGSAQKTPGVVAEAEDEVGDVIATDTNGVKEKLSNEFVVVSDLDLAATAVLGTLDVTSKALLLGVTVTTGKGKAPTLSAEGATMGTSAAQGATIELPAITVLALHKAQILGAAFTLAGEGCKLNECSLKFSCANSLAESAGEILAHDVQRGMLEVTANIVASAAGTPTVTATSGWEITEGPSKAEPEGGHDTYTVTLTKPVASTPLPEA